jgi:hypothetical protein
MAFVIAESFGSGNDLSHICLSSIVSIEIKKGKKIFYLFEIKSWILCDDGFREDSTSFFLNYGFFVNTHYRYINFNII